MGSQGVGHNGATFIFTDSMHMNLNKLQEIVKNREAWCAAIHEVTKNQIWLSD